MALLNMEDADADFQLSSNASDFEGFDEADYNNQVARPMPNESHISLSDIPSSSEEDSEDDVRIIAPNADINNRTWHSLDMNNAAKTSIYRFKPGMYLQLCRELY